MNDVLLYYAAILLRHPKTFEILKNHHGYDWQYVSDYYTKYGSNSLVISARKGKDNNPFLLENPRFDKHFRMPDTDPMFNKTFQQVSDEAAISLLKNMPNDRQLLINWSGGIDSTVPLVAILKTWPAADQKRIVIGLNEGSIYENPNFYWRYIKDRFPVKSSYDPLEIEKYVVVDGDPELPSANKYLNLINRYPGLYDKPISQGYRDYVEFFTEKINKNFAVTNYENLLENIESVDYGIQTMGDFIWWENFNLHWKGVMGMDLFKLYPDQDVEQFLEHYVLWYSAEDYQKWIIKNRGPGQTHGKDLTYLKIAHKRYIHDFDKNDFFLDFKTKFPSGTRPHTLPSICMITNDYRKLNLRDHFDEVVERIPSLLRPCSQ